MAISSNATPATASWSRSCSLKFTRACVLVISGSGCSPPCVTRWSGGAVVHDRGALLRRGLRRRTTTHHVVELGSQHYRGQFNVVPGTVCRRWFFTSSCARSTAGGDVLSTRSTGIFVVMVVLVQLCCARRLGDGIYCCTTARWFGAARRLAAGALCSIAATSRSGSFNAAIAGARADGVVRSAAAAPLRLLPLTAVLLAALFVLLVSYTASSACCRSRFCRLPVPFSVRNYHHTTPFFTINP